MSSAYDNLVVGFISESESRFQSGLSQSQVINSLGVEFSVHGSLISKFVPAVDAVRSNLGNNITTIFSSILLQHRASLDSRIIDMLFQAYNIFVITPSSTLIPKTTVSLSESESAQFDSFVLPDDFNDAFSAMATIIQTRYDSDVARPMELDNVIAIGNKTMELPAGQFSAAKLITLQTASVLVCHGTVISAPNIVVTADPANIFGCIFNYTTFFKSSGNLTALQTDFADIVAREELGVAEQMLINSVGAITFS